MTLSFAGVGLPLSTPELEDRLSRIHPPELFKYIDLWQFAGHGLENLPTPSLPEFPPIKPGVLRWPTGACRPAFFFAVVNQSKVDEIRGAVGNPMVPQSLQMNDGRTGKTITAEMYLLPFLPLSQFGTDHAVYEDGWLMILTDQRFYWWWKYGDIEDEFRESWTALLNQIADNLGISIDLDTIDPAYTNPTEKWLGFNRPMPTMLDAALAQIGQRLVCNLDGTVRSVTWQTAKFESDFYLDSSTVMSGGFINDADLGRYVPHSVSVFFASGGGGCCAPHPYIVPRALGALHEASAIFGASGVIGASGMVYGDAIFDGTNAVALGNYATVAATDFYGWRSPNADTVFPGIEPWAPTGFEDYVEWTYQRREAEPYASTMVRRGEFDAIPSGTWEVGDCCEFFVQITGGSDAAGYSGFRVVLLGPNQWSAATAPMPLNFTNNIWRAKSNEVAPIKPPIAAGQVVRVWRSPTYGPVSGTPQYECLPWGSQNMVTVLGTNCLPVNVWGVDLYSAATSPPPPPPPPIDPTTIGRPTSSPGPGVIKTGTNVRILTREISGGPDPHTVLVNFADGFFATGEDVTHVYATAGLYYPTITVFDASGNSSGQLLLIGGDGGSSILVLDDPGLAVTLTIYRLNADVNLPDATLVSVTDLTAWVSSGLEYEFEGVLPADVDATGGIQVTINGTATFTEIIWQTQIWPSNDSVPLFRRDVAKGDPQSYQGATEVWIYFKGSFKVDDEGTVGIFAAQAVDSGTSTLLKGGTFAVRLTQPTDSDW